VPPADLTMIVPTYNERERIEELVRGLFAACAGRLELEVVIVDDNSPDGTGILADQLAAAHRIRVVHRAGKLGLGSAVVAGVAVATAPVIGIMDGDFSHPPSAVPAMYAAFGDVGCDFLVASRYIPGGSTRNWPLRRRLMSRVGCLLARGLTPVQDATSGFFFLTRDVVDRAVLKATGFKICLELLLNGRPRLVAEAPYEFEERAEGRSKMTAAEGWGYLRQLMRFYRQHTTRGVARPAYRRCTPRDMAAIAGRGRPGGHR
jgi:dolichol-phosphate mannosyltransferase